MEQDFFKLFTNYAKTFDTINGNNITIFKENNKDSLITKILKEGNIDKAQFKLDHQLEIYALESMFLNYQVTIPSLLVEALTKIGYDIKLKEDARITFKEFEVMIKDYLTESKVNRIADILSKIMTKNNGKKLKFDTELSLSKLRTVFGNVCQKAYRNMLNYVMVDYISGNSISTNSNRVDHTDSILIG